MSEQRIKYVRKSAPHEGITHVGSDDWALSVQEVIRAMGNGTTYYTVDKTGNRAEVGIVEGRTGPYLRSSRDGSEPDNLLSLPDFPFFRTGNKCTIPGRYASTTLHITPIIMAAGRSFPPPMTEWKLVL